jgi:four helix bundle protein
LEQIVQDFRKPKVWQKAHEITLSIYTATEKFPATERYGLTSQMRRAASSIAANIAEGCARSSDADFARFLHHAMGSASELEYFLLLARDLRFLDKIVHEQTTSEAQAIKRMLTALITKLRADS